MVIFYLKIYAVIIAGMFYGMENFPAQALMNFCGAVFFIQLLAIALVNERFFSDLTVNFALSASKLLFCVG